MTSPTEFLAHRYKHPMRVGRRVPDRRYLSGTLRPQYTLGTVDAVVTRHRPTFLTAHGWCACGRVLTGWDAWTAHVREIVACDHRVTSPLDDVLDQCAECGDTLPAGGV